MDTLRFLKLVLPPAPRYYAQLLKHPYSDANPTPSRHAPTLELLAQFVQATDARGWDAYVSMAGYTADAKGHYAAFVTAHMCHYVDLDCGAGKPYATHADGLRALNAFLDSSGLPRPLTVISGNGLHLYWPYDEPVENRHWLKIAYLLRQVLQAGGLKIDGGCGIDPSRLLRPTGTHNRKNPAVPLAVRVPDTAQHDYQPLNLLTFAKQLFALAGPNPVLGPVPGTPQYDSDLSAGMKDPYSVDRVAEQCAMVAWHVRNGGSPENGHPGMTQPTWRGIAGIYKFSEEGAPRFHIDAQQYTEKGYTQRARIALLNRTDHSGSLCSSLANAAHETAICAACPHRAFVRSPVTLGTKRVADDPAPAQNDSPSVSADPMFSDAKPTGGLPVFLQVQGYRHLPLGAAKVISKDDGKEQTFTFCSHIITDAVRLNERHNGMQYSFTFESLDPQVQADVRRCEVILDAHQLTRLTDIQEVLMSNGVIPHSNGRNNFIMGYINAWANETLRRSGDLAATQMGWQDDGSFVLGEKRLLDGRDAPLYLTPRIRDTARAYTTAGSQEKWLEAARIFCTTGSEDRCFQHILGLCISLASPLLKFTPLYGAVWSFCTGESGRGKTTVAEFGNSVWGDPHLLTKQAEADSGASIHNRLVAVNSLPLLLDEATNADIDKLAKLIVTVHAGQAPARASDGNGQNRAAAGWSTFVITGTNTLISGRLAERQTDSNGEHARLIEIQFSADDDFTDEGREAIRIMRENFGWLGPRWMTAITKNPDFFQQFYTRMEASLIKDWSMRIGTERVWLVGFSTVLEVAQLLNLTKVLGFQINFEGFKAWLYKRVGQMRDYYTGRNYSVAEQVSEIMSSTIQKNGISLTSLRAAVSTPAVPDNEVRVPVARNDWIIEGDIHRRPDVIMVRYELATGMAWISCRLFNELAGANHDELRRKAIQLRILHPDIEQKRLTAGTELAHKEAKYRCYVVNMHRLDELVLTSGAEKATVTELKQRT